MIRFVIGLLLVFGAAGGVDSASDTELFYVLAVAAAGLTLMYFGANKMERP
jgi:type IV secretory pathway VirB2 component (pilin)